VFTNTTSRRNQSGQSLCQRWKVPPAKAITALGHASRARREHPSRGATQIYSCSLHNQKNFGPKL